MQDFFVSPVTLNIGTDNLTAAKQQQCSPFCQPRDFDYCYRRFDLFDLTHCNVQLTGLYLFWAFVLDNFGCLLTAANIDKRRITFLFSLYPSL